MSETKQGMNIGAASRYAKVSVFTIRAWEKRYRLVKPRRLPNGRRIYSEEDAERIRLLGLLVHSGHQISYVAGLTNHELVRLVRLLDAESGSGAGLDFDDATAAAATLQHTLYLVERFDLPELALAMARARTRFSARGFVLNFAAALIGKIGQLVAANSLTLAQEHAVSALLRTHLSQIVFEGGLRTDSTTSSRLRSSITFGTQDGDYHELGILMAAALCNLKGIPYNYLGASLPAESFASAAKALKSKILVIGHTIATGKDAVTAQRRYIAQLHKELPAQYSIWIGGRCDIDVDMYRTLRDVRHIRSLTDFEVMLAQGHGRR